MAFAKFCQILVKYESPSEDIPVIGMISLFIEEKVMFSLNFSPNSHVAPLTIFLFQYGRILMTFDGKLCTNY